MAAGTKDLFIEQGATFAMSLLWRRESPDGGVTPGALYDLTGCTARSQLRTAIGAVPALLELTEVAGITLGGVAGTILYVITDEQTMLLVVKKALYDLYVTFPSGETRRVLKGKVIIDPTVTDPT